MSDLKRVDIKPSKEAAEFFQGLDRTRFEQLRRDVRPLIDPLKPMLYTASGNDIASFLGSGANKAEFVDPIYETNSKNGKGITPLVNWISKIDPNLVAEINFQPGIYVSARINFQFEGQKELKVIGTDAREYKPESGSYSVYASIGHGTPELFLPSCDAQVYVISHLSPKAWGYTNIVKPFVTEADGFPVATGYQDLKLTYQEMVILTDLNTSIRVMESIANNLEAHKLDNLKEMFSRNVIQEVNPEKDRLEYILQKHWQKRLSPLTNLNSYSRKAFVEDMERYLDVLFGNSPSVKASLSTAVNTYK